MRKGQERRDSIYNIQWDSYKNKSGDDLTEEESLLIIETEMEMCIAEAETSLISNESWNQSAKKDEHGMHEAACDRGLYPWTIVGLMTMANGDDD